MSVKTYSKEKDGDKKVSDNFRVDEFACNDGSDTILIADELVAMLQLIRNHFKRSVVLNSGFRTIGYNRRIGGASNSYHTKGMAADFNVAGYSPSSVRRVIESGMIRGIDTDKIGLGSYENFTHIDCRGHKSRW